MDTPTRTRMRIVATVLGVSAALVLPASAASAAPATDLPTTLHLPDGFAPEGIAIGSRPVAYLGNRVDGSIYRADLVTGTGQIISPATGTPALGLKTDQRGRLFVAGGSAGDARVVDTRTGAVLASYQFATDTSFVNDVVLTPHAAYFTDSLNPVLYALPLGAHGSLPGPQAVLRIPLTGALQYGTGFNANGIARTPDGCALLIVQSNTGGLFRVDPGTGVTTQVDLGEETLVNGDGLLLLGRTLYAVQNRLNAVAEIQLDRAGTSGTVLRRLTDPGFDTPTTVASFGDQLYLPNARFTVTPTPTTPYTVVAIARAGSPE